MINAPKGAFYECRNCRLNIRQLNASISLNLRMKGLSPSRKVRKGFAVKRLRMVMRAHLISEMRERAASNLT